MKREVANKIFLLKVISNAQKIHDRKLNQMVFILQQEGRKENKKTFNYDFSKWSIEPYSPELEKDIEHLLFEKLVINEDGLCLTANGKNYLRNSMNVESDDTSDTFLKFHMYLYLGQPTQTLRDMIYKRYEIGKFQNREIVSAIDHYDENKGKLKVTEARSKIQSTFEEIEKNDEEYAERMRLIMNEIRTIHKDF